MSNTSTGHAEWEHAALPTRGPKQRSVARVELITTAALAVSTAVAVTAVSIGIARADAIGATAHGAGTRVAVALFLGVLLSGMGGLTAIMANGHRQHD
jgi:hypothetical protein